MTDKLLIEEPVIESGIYIQFASPGSANIILVQPKGNVSPFQLFTASKYLEMLATDAFQENKRVQNQMEQMLLRK